MTSLTPFSFDSREIRVLTVNNEPWFVAKDVAEALEYTRFDSNLINHVPDEWKGMNPIRTPSGIQEMWCLSEPGLYFFLNRSDKPKALPFQKWAAGEVFPAIRKTGSYALPGASSNSALAAQLADLLQGKVLVDYTLLADLANTAYALRHMTHYVGEVATRIEQQIGKPLLNRVGDAPASQGGDPVSAPLPVVRPIQTGLDQPRVAAYLADKTRVTSDQIIIEVLGEQPTKSLQVQVGLTMRRLGWTSQQATTGDRSRYYQRPA